MKHIGRKAIHQRRCFLNSHSEAVRSVREASIWFAEANIVQRFADIDGLKTSR